MVFTAFHQWLETHSLRSDKGLASAQRRYARRLLREVTKDIALRKGIQKALETGEKGMIDKAVKSYAKVMANEFTQLESIIIEHKTLLNRNLDGLERLKREIHAGAAGADKAGLLERITAIERDVGISITALERGFTSFENTTFSAKKLLDRASQLQDAYYNLAQSRKDVAELDRELGIARAEERKGAGMDGAKVLRELDEIEKELRAELSHQSAGIGDAFIILQEIMAEIDGTRKLLQERTENGFYPEPWAAEQSTVLSGIERDVSAWVIKEIAEGRIFLSDVQRTR